MSALKYLRVGDVIESFTELGGEADWADVLEHITQKRGHPYAPYKDVQNYKNSMLQIVQRRCEGYKKFNGTIVFERIQDMRFRLVSSATAPKKFRKSPAEIHPETVPTDREYIAGTVHQVLINAFERDKNARRECIEFHGLQCAVCSMSFEQQYGPIGEGFIHVHHNKPLASGEVYVLDPVKDLVPVCPNCHAMLHAYSPPLSVGELKNEILKRTG